MPNSFLWPNANTNAKSHFCLGHRRFIHQKLHLHSIPAQRPVFFIANSHIVKQVFQLLNVSDDIKTTFWYYKNQRRGFLSPVKLEYWQYITRRRYQHTKKWIILTKLERRFFLSLTKFGSACASVLI